MRFYLQQNVLCLAYQDPLLLERSRGWTLQNHFPAAAIPRYLPAENDAPGDFCRFEGEDGSEAPVPVRELMAVPPENALGWGPAAR